MAASRETSESRLTTENLGKRPKIWLLAAGAAVVIGVVLTVVVMSGGSKTPTPPSQPAASSRAEVDKHLSAAAARISDGKLVGPGGDTALDHLLEAKRLAPTDKQVLAQLHALADTFEKLGDGASAAGDLGEAAAHLQAALSAEPDRATVAAKLADVEQRARGGK